MKNRLAIAWLILLSCGSVLIDAHGQLYFRDNYNRSRYCTDERNYTLTFGPLALKAYGRELPECTR